MFDFQDSSKQGLEKLYQLLQAVCDGERLKPEFEDLQSFAQLMPRYVIDVSLPNMTRRFIDKHAEKLLDKLRSEVKNKKYESKEMVIPFVSLETLIVLGSNYTSSFKNFHQPSGF